MSETITNPKFIDNRKYIKKSTSSDTNFSEPESLIYEVKSEKSMIQTVVFKNRDYLAFNCLPEMMCNLKKFTVMGNSVFRVDTTFELVDGLWLTDSTYTNEALINSEGKHPEFPGPSIWHFHKDRECYRRFASEIVMVEPELINIKKVGHDLDQAIPNGLTDIFIRAKKLWCMQHLQERDAYKLKQFGANKRTVERIMADIYGSQNSILLESGLADSYDEEDFNVKLESLASIWNELVPGFHDWFKRKRKQMFCESIILSARKALGIEGRFYTNGLELKHKLQKKKLAEEDVVKEVSAVTATLQQWVLEFHTEESRALRGLGKYRLSPGFDQFTVEPTKWNQWSLQRQEEHLKQFRSYIPSSYNAYTKPKVAGLKSTPGNSRRARQPEPELFRDRFNLEQQPNEVMEQQTNQNVTPLKLHKSSDDSNWEVCIYIPSLK